MGNFSFYMNEPTPCIEVGGVYYNNVEMYDNPFIVKEIYKEGLNYYAKCTHLDEFTGKEVELDIYSFYLEKEGV